MTDTEIRETMKQAAILAAQGKTAEAEAVAETMPEWAQEAFITIIDQATGKAPAPADGVNVFIAK